MRQSSVTVPRPHQNGADGTSGPVPPGPELESLLHAQPQSRPVGQSELKLVAALGPVSAPAAGPAARRAAAPPAAARGGERSGGSRGGGGGYRG